MVTKKEVEIKACSSNQVQLEQPWPAEKCTSSFFLLQHCIGSEITLAIKMRVVPHSSINKTSMIKPNLSNFGNPTLAIQLGQSNFGNQAQLEQFWTTQSTSSKLKQSTINCQVTSQSQVTFLATGFSCVCICVCICICIYV